MQFKNILLASAIAFTSMVSAAPAEVSPRAGFNLFKRAITVTSDTGSESITPAITPTDTTSDLDDVGGKADAVGAVAEVVGKVVKLVQGLVDEDKARRQRFTKEVVSSVKTQFPSKTVVMCNVGYKITGTPDVKSSTSYKAKVGSNVSYDVLVFGAGVTFTRQGDGGFENWAHNIAKGCTANGAVITC